MKPVVSLLAFVLSIPWLFIAPGYLTQLWFIWRWPLLQKRNWMDTAFISVLFSVCLTGWIGLVLVEFGWFSIIRLLAFDVGYCFVLGLWLAVRKREKVWRAQRHLWVSGDQWVWLLTVVLIVASMLFFHPHEYVLGGSDAGVYVNLGAHITRSGSLLHRDPDVADLQPSIYPALFREQPGYFITRFIQFPGFFLSDDQAGLIIPQFYPLHPIWMSVFQSLGGVRASLYVAPLWGVMGILAVGMTAGVLFGKRTGVLAAALLAISATQIWFARYPTSEALTQFLMFGGIYAFSRYMMEDSPEMGVLAGVSLGQVMLVRLDTYFLLAIPFLLASYLRLTRQFARRHLAFFVPFLVLSLHSLAHGFFQSWPYLYNSYRYQLKGSVFQLMVTGASGALVGFFFLDRWTDGQPERLRMLARWLRRGSTVLAILVILAAVYGYFIRPQQADQAAVFPYWYADSTIPDVEPYNLVRLGWYLSPLGIALAVLGAWWMLRHELNLKTALFLGVGLFFSILYLQNSRNNPHHIYVMRRYVPVVIPAFVIAAAYALVRWWCRQDRWRWLAWGVAVAQVVLVLYAARVVVRHVDYRGVLDQLTQWSDKLDHDAVILFDDDKPVSTGATVGTSLRYLFERTVFDLQEQYLTEEILESLMDHWQEQGRSVLVAVGPNGVREPFSRWTVTPQPGLWLDTQVLESSYTDFPRRIQRATLALELYELKPGTADAPSQFRVDIGASDILYLGEGWYEKERLPDGTSMRWTTGAAEIVLAKHSLGEGETSLDFRLAASPHPGLAPAEVNLRFCEGSSECAATNETGIVARWQVGAGFAEYEAVVSAAALRGDTALFRLETDTWSPNALGLSADARNLGVMVDWVDVVGEP